MTTDRARHPWGAVIALLLGFFMIMIDTTIVTIAAPQILQSLDTDIVGVQWVQSAYLLALAVPMLVAGRLGDRYGQKNLTIIGLALFTGASICCGLATSIGALIAARAVQGVGAACISPQSMAIITRIFPPQQRGTPLGLWGAVAGIAMIAGPLLGGVLVAAFSWHAVFFINAPLGLLAIVLTLVLVPSLPRHRLHLDYGGVALSAIGLMCLVTGLQEGERVSWGHLWGPFYTWGLIGFGLAMMLAFVWWERQNPRDPLVPVQLFQRRNFALGSTAILIASFAMTAIPVPLMFYYQIARGLSPAQAAIILIPMAVVSGMLAPAIGRLTARIDPRTFALSGLLIMVVAVAVYFQLLSPETPIAWFFLPSAIAGLGSACIWGPISVIASHDLEPPMAGTGSAIYNEMRQLGAVMGSAAITSMMEGRLTHELPGHSKAATDLLGATDLLPTALIGPFTTAMAESLVLPAGLLVLAALVALAIARRPAAGVEPSGLAEITSLGQELPVAGDSWRPAFREAARGTLDDADPEPRRGRRHHQLLSGAPRLSHRSPDDAS